MPISFLFFLKKKKWSFAFFECGERKKKKQVRSYREKRSHNAARVFKGQKGCTMRTFLQKCLAHARIFGMFLQGFVGYSSFVGKMMYAHFWKGNTFLKEIYADAFGCRRKWSSLRSFLSRKRVSPFSRKRVSPFQESAYSFSPNMRLLLFPISVRSS